MLVATTLPPGELRISIPILPSLCFIVAASNDCATRIVVKNVARPRIRFICNKDAAFIYSCIRLYAETDRVLAEPVESALLTHAQAVLRRVTRPRGHHL